MRLLSIYFADTNHNSYPQKLQKSLSEKGIVVEKSLSKLWEPNKNYDLIHIQWIDSIFKWKPPSNSQLEKLENTLLLWRQNNVKIITTRHNHSRHISSNENDLIQFNKLFQLVYNFCDGIIHLGSTSISLLHRDFKINKYIEHTIIPHGIYEYKNSLSQEECRKTLRIPMDKKVILVFGKVRNKQEKRLIISSFNKLQITNKYLLANRWLYSKSFLSRNIEKISNRLIKKNNNLFDKLIENDEVQLYFKSADIIFVPRAQSLNSGVVILGFSFGKVVIGSEYGNIGEILIKTGNPTFLPNKIESILKAIKEGFDLNYQNKGKENFEYANKNWNWNIISNLHIDFYKQVINK